MDDPHSDYFLQLLDHPNCIPVAGMIVGAVAIVAGATVTIVLARLALAHRQRMAMIARGMHPDADIYEDQADERGPASG